MRVNRILPLLLGGLLLAGCGGGTADSPAQPTLATPLPTPTSLPTSAPTPFMSEATLPPVSQLTIWWPEPLAPVDQAEVTEVLNAQIEAFGSAEDSIVNIEFRLKRPQEVGGVMQTLRSASQVAPGALPDLTLMRREDMLVAAADGLIYPLEGLISSGIIGDLYAPALALGRYEGQIYGLPYMLDVRHIAYRPRPVTSTQWSFDGIVESGIQWAFPVGRTAGVNDTLYLQYLDAGGTPPDAEGNFTLNAAALEQVLLYYENAGETLSENVVSYTTQADYLPDLAAGRLQAGVLDSTTFLQLREEDNRLLAAPIPTLSGDASATLNGWMWVLTTTNSEQQAQAARFLNWMMEADRQRQYAETIAMLPSQRSVLQSLDVVFMNTLVENAVVPPRGSSSLTRVIQNAVTRVLNGDVSAAQAVQEVAQTDNE
ncbi:MAG: hypothetical protein OHK0046_32280 [Anaerolineae bacterium]